MEGDAHKQAGEPANCSVKNTVKVSLHLLSIVVPGGQSAIREHPVHDQSIRQDIYASRPPFAPLLQPIPLHLQSQQNSSLGKTSDHRKAVTS